MSIFIPGLPAGATKGVRTIEKSSNKKAVIGEGMQRVESKADEIKAETFQGITLEENKEWIQDKVKNNYEIIDIGPDFTRRYKRSIEKKSSRSPNSPFYEMERYETKNYDGYKKDFERTGEMNKTFRDKILK